MFVRDVGLRVGACGLKFSTVALNAHVCRRAPRRSLWIEIWLLTPTRWLQTSRAPRRSLWIEIRIGTGSTIATWSGSA